MKGTRGIPSGELQTEILRVLNRLGKASAGEILMELGDRGTAYTTVNTVLDRLFRRGLVTRSKTPGRGGVKYVYSPASNAYLRTNIIPEALNALVRAFGPTVVPAIYEGLENISTGEAVRTAKTGRPRKRKG